MPSIVLDTNVVLDWLHFEDSSTEALDKSIAANRLTVLANELTADELRRVLAYSKLNIEPERQASILSRYLELTKIVAMPANFARDKLLLPDRFPRCADADDQHFLALTFHAKAAALVTKDKALLKLHRKMQRFGLRIVHPISLAEMTTDHS